MEVKFSNHNLDRLETDIEFNAGFSREIVRAFRKRMQFIRASLDERSFYIMRSLHFEKLKGKRSHQYSMRLNKQWRLIIEFKKANTDTTVVVVGIKDYHA